MSTHPKTKVTVMWRDGDHLTAIELAPDFDLAFLRAWSRARKDYTAELWIRGSEEPPLAERLAEVKSQGGVIHPTREAVA